MICYNFGLGRQGAIDVVFAYALIGFVFAKCFIQGFPGLFGIFCVCLKFCFKIEFFGSTYNFKIVLLISSVLGNIDEIWIGQL